MDQLTFIDQRKANYAQKKGINKQDVIPHLIEVYKSLNMNNIRFIEYINEVVDDEFHSRNMPDIYPPK